MNPRYRRLLIPGLLTLLLVVVVVASLVQDAQASDGGPAPEEVSRIDDPRVTESSGLAVSRRHDDLAYTVNDSGHEPLVLAVRVSTGEVVGATRLLGEGFRDVEALALDADGRLWVADTGDNRGVRHDASVYVLDEPGVGDGVVEPTRYPIAYDDDASPDVEAMVVHDDGTVELFSKNLSGGESYELAPGTLEAGSRAVAELTADDLPLMITDAALSPDGRRLLLRTYVSVVVLDASDPDRAPVATLPVTGLRQGETVAVEPAGDTFLVGSEGAGQPLWRLALPEPAASTPVADAASSSAERPVSAPQREALGLTTVVGATAAVAVVAAVSLGLRRRRS
jgi:DNA-binding beta-propeller fold protein YncE